MPLPTGVKVEVEFTSGVWTDVTADFDYNVGYTIAVGRTTPSGQAQVSTCQVQFRNPLGAYTPGVQVLSDGTAAPYYPNVQIRKRLRVSDSAGVQFVGGIKSWVPQTNGFGGSSFCVVSASDLMDRLSRVTMTSPLRAEILADAPLLYWPLTDAVGATVAAEQSGNAGTPLTVAQQGTGGPLVFGDNGPGFGDGTGVKLAPASTSNGQYLIAPGVYADIVEFSILMAAAPASPVCLIGQSSVDAVSGAQLWHEVGIDAAGHVTLTNNSGALALASAANIADGNWHDVIAWHGSGINAATLTVDGVTVTGGAIPLAVTSPVLYVGQSALASGRASALPTCNIGQIVSHSVRLSAARMSAHFSALRGWSGETVDARIKRFLGYAGLTAADWNIDASIVVCGSYPQAGKDVVSGCQDMAVTEGGGSVFYVQGGVVQFRNRADRKPAAPVLTIQAGKDDTPAYQPSLDDQNLANTSTASRATESGTASQQTVTDPIRSSTTTGDGPITQDVTTYTVSDADALALAQSIVAGGLAGWRLPRITVDLLTATHNLYATVQALTIGDRLRVTGLPAGQAPSTQLDVIAEGWTRTVNVNTNSVAIDSSPADNPARHVFDDTSYGRFQALSDCKMNAAITNAATTVVIASPTGPAFTTTPAAYPLKITVGAERITLTSAPGGAVSPQTFTGVTRGVDGTPASAQAINAPVTLWPASTFTL